MASDVVTVHPADAMAYLGNVLQRLDDIMSALESHSPAVAWGGATAQEELENWPIAGERRVVTSSVCRGGVIAVVAGSSPVKLLPFNSARAGLELVNFGSNPCLVYLGKSGDAQGGGIGVMWLSGNGGSWDGKITDALWCGPVAVQSTLGTTLSLAVL